MDALDNTNVDEKVVLPKSVTINGVAYSVNETPELQQFIQAVAKVERSKLRSQFEAMNQKINELKTAQVVKVESEDNVMEKIKGSFVTKEELKEILPGVLKEVVEPLLKSDAQRHLTEIEEYRNKLIKENEGRCIPELVEGATKEELDASLQKSIEIRTKYHTPFMDRNQVPSGKVTDPLLADQLKELDKVDAGSPTPAQTSTQKTTQVQAPQQEVTPGMPRRQSPEVSEQSNVKRMTMTEFEKNREQLRNQLEAMYGGNAL